MSAVEEVKLIEFSNLGDERGSLITIEQERQIPFDIKRVFYSYGMDNKSVRGKHANKYSEFCLIALAGSCKVKVLDNQGNEKIFQLDNPAEALYIPKMIWKDMYDFSSSCILLVISNEFYDKNEYINVLDDYLKGGTND